jgi:hypothetical protein
MVMGFRDLYSCLLESPQPAGQYLAVNRDEISSQFSRFHKYGSIEAMGWRVGEQPHLNEPFLFDLWELYAFARVNDVLLLGFQPDNPTIGEWSGSEITPEQYRQFMLSLDLSEMSYTGFHPFFHEIVEVEQTTDADEPITLVETVWPGYMLGIMLLSRAGVKVRGGANHILKEVAQNSTLYWTFRRRNRLVDDLSHGWGSNSQWRTTFRRDYQTAMAFYYNVDEMPEEGISTLPALYQNELTADERIELVRYRCFVKTTKPHLDLFPYNDFYVEEKG